MRRAALMVPVVAVTATLAALVPGGPANAQTTSYESDTVRVIVPADQNAQVACPKGWEIGRAHV